MTHIVERLRKSAEEHPTLAIIRMALINDQLRKNAEELQSAIGSGDAGLIAEKAAESRAFLDSLDKGD